MRAGIKITGGEETIRQSGPDVESVLLYYQEWVSRWPPAKVIEVTGYCSIERRKVTEHPQSSPPKKIKQEKKPKPGNGADRYVLSV